MEAPMELPFVSGKIQHDPGLKIDLHLGIDGNVRAEDWYMPWLVLDLNSGPVLDLKKLHRGVPVCDRALISISELFPGIQFLVPAEHDEHHFQILIFQDMLSKTIRSTPGPSLI